MWVTAAYGMLMLVFGLCRENDLSWKARSCFPLYAKDEKDGKRRIACGACKGAVLEHLAPWGHEIQLRHRAQRWLRRRSLSGCWWGWAWLPLLMEPLIEYIGDEPGEDGLGEVRRLQDA